MFMFRRVCQQTQVCLLLVLQTSEGVDGAGQLQRGRMGLHGQHLFY